MSVLHVDHVTKAFGDLIAVEDVSLSLEEGELAALIGPNGAGKTTLFNVISGALAPSEGALYYRETEITDKPVHAITNLGLARTFQIVNLFPGLTAFETVRLATQRGRKHDYDILSNVNKDDEVTEATHAILERVGLEAEADEEVRNLPHGDRRKLEIAVPLGTDPDVLLLDEPTSGLSVDEVDPIKELILELAEDYTMLFIEHDMDVTLSIAETVHVLSQGNLIASGPPNEIERNERVRGVYLGEDHA
jgi:branched-chain amino acid transport system ATP-binding protein